jgi:hypothetical protein
MNVDEDDDNNTMAEIEFAAEPTREAFPDRPAPATSPKILISIPTDAEGKPDFSKVRDKTASRVRELFNAPETKVFLGEKGAGELIPVSPLLTNALLSSFFQVEAVFFAWRYKIELKEANEIFKLTPAEHEQIEPALNNVLAKHGPEFLKKYQDELALAFLLVNISQAKFSSGKAFAENKHSSKKEASPDNSGKTTESGLPFEIKPVGEPLAV